MKPKFHPMTFLRNLKWAFLRNGVDSQQALERRVLELERLYGRLNPSRSEFLDLLLFEDVLNSDDPRFRQERECCRRHGRLEIFPYEKMREFPEVKVHFDSGRNLPFILHCGKKLYYPAAWGEGTVTHSYINSVAVEGILGGGCLAKSPHNYLDERFPVKDGAVFCDLGAAEGMVALQFADSASHIVIGECDGKWHAPLRATFEPYAGKTTFVVEPLGLGGESMAILSERSPLAGGGNPFFLKFDIEGAERFALQQAEGFFRSHSDVTVACATYHRQDDGRFLEQLFHEWGYETAFSDGVMLFLLDHLTSPYFRHGVLYAKNA